MPTPFLQPGWFPRPLVRRSLLLTALLIHSAPTAQTDEPLQYPLAVTAREDGVVFVADRGLPGIWKIESGHRSVFFRGSKRFRTPLNAVRCLTIDHQGRLLAGDSSTRDVYRFDEQNRPQPLTDGAIGIPMSIAVAPDGTIYTADLELHRIWKMPAAGSKTPQESAVINSPRGLALDDSGTLWVLSTSSQHGQIQKVDPDGQIYPFVTSHPFRLPHKLVLLDDGSACVTDNYSHCVWRVTTDGHCEKWVDGPPLDRPVGLCRLADDLLITDPHIRTIFRLSPDRQLSVFAADKRPQSGTREE